MPDREPDWVIRLGSETVSDDALRARLDGVAAVAGAHASLARAFQDLGQQLEVQIRAAVGAGATPDQVADAARLRLAAVERVLAGEPLIPPLL